MMIFVFSLVKHDVISDFVFQNVVNFCFKAVKSRQTIAELHQST